MQKKTVVKLLPEREDLLLDLYFFSRRLLGDMGPNDDPRLIFININRVLK
jgi:hypothetical protein